MSLSIKGLVEVVKFFWKNNSYLEWGEGGGSRCLPTLGREAVAQVGERQPSCVSTWRAKDQGGQETWRLGDAGYSKAWGRPR